MSSKPLVSVLIPVYNGSEFLEEAIVSVLKSSYNNIEIILVDDGSTDQSKKKCLDFEKKYKKVKFFGFSQNKGMTRCLNFGAKKAKGKYIARINQDDVMIMTRIEKQVSFLERNKDHVVVGGSIRLFTEDSNNFDKITFPRTDLEIRNQWMMMSPYSDPTVMYRRSTYLKTEGYSQYFWPADDVHMWYQLGQFGKLANLPDVLTKVRWHEECGSIKLHRRQMFKTWQVHQWAGEFIQKPTLGEKFFWYSQFIAGLIFPAEFNWKVYRLIRKIQNKISMQVSLPNFSAVQNALQSFTQIRSFAN